MKKSIIKFLFVVAMLAFPAVSLAAPSVSGFTASGCEIAVNHSSCGILAEGKISGGVTPVARYSGGHATWENALPLSGDFTDGYVDGYYWYIATMPKVYTVSIVDINGTLATKNVTVKCAPGGYWIPGTGYCSSVPPDPLAPIMPADFTVASGAAWSVTMTAGEYSSYCEFTRTSTKYGDIPTATVGLSFTAVAAPGAFIGPGTLTYSARCMGYSGNWSPYSSTVVTVLAPVNTPPTANAGSDKAVTLPISSVAMTGSGSDAEGAVTYAWTFISGPLTPIIVTPTSPTTNITGMTTAGTYKFLLTVKDTGGLTDTDEVWVVVSDAANVSPTADAGPDCAITLPIDYCNGQAGSGSDADGSIVSYRWTKISGPSATISSPNSATTNFTGMSTVGTYIFHLTVTDNDGATGFDEMRVTVSPDASPPDAPSSVSATPGGCDSKLITVAWSASPGATSYTLYDNGTELRRGITSTSYSHTSLAEGSSHNYEVVAVNLFGNSAKSTPAGATAPSACMGLPATPTGLSASVTDCAMGIVFISWNTAINADKYHLFDGSTEISTGPGTTFNHTGLAPGSTHRYSVYSENTATGDVSAPSSVVSITVPNVCPPPPPPPGPPGPPGPPPPPPPPGPPGDSDLIPCGKYQNAEKITTDPCEFKHVIELIKNILNFLIFKIASPLAAVMFAYAGFLYVTNAGNEGKVKQAHDIFLYTFWGFVVCLAAWLTVNMILTFFIGSTSDINFLG